MAHHTGASWSSGFAKAPAGIRRIRTHKKCSVSVDCFYVLPGACFSPRLVCVAVLGLIDLCLGRSVHALAALSVPVDVTIMNDHSLNHCCDYLPMLANHNHHSLPHSLTHRAIVVHAHATPMGPLFLRATPMDWSRHFRTPCS